MKYFYIFLCLIILFAGCTPSTNIDEPEIYPLDCRIKPGEEIDFTLDFSGNVVNVSWEVTKGEIPFRTDSGRTITYKAPLEQGVATINAVITMKDGGQKLAQIRCEIVEFLDTPTVFAVYSPNATTLIIPVFSATPTLPQIVSTEKARVVTIKADSIRFYAGPSLLHKVVSDKKYLKGDVVTILGRTSDGEWLYARSSDNIVGWLYIGWINASEVDINAVEVIYSLPTMPPPIQTRKPRDPTMTPGPHQPTKAVGVDF